MDRYVRTRRQVRQAVHDTGISRRRRFERAYRTGAWTSTGESLSGDGSRLVATEKLRAQLPDALRRLGVRELLDVPCGDWNWMSRTDLPIEHYTGGDLLPAVVNRNRDRFGDERHEFRVIDLCADSLPRADLLLCRDALIHFSYADTWRAFRRIVDADIEYVALTNFPTTQANTDIATGIQWRPVNLEVAPFDFPPPMLVLHDGASRPDQVLSIWKTIDLRPRVTESV